MVSPRSLEQRPRRDEARGLWPCRWLVSCFLSDCPGRQVQVTNVGRIPGPVAAFVAAHVELQEIDVFRAALVNGFTGEVVNADAEGRFLLHSDENECVL